MKKAAFALVVVSILLFGCLKETKSVGCCEKETVKDEGYCKLYNGSNLKVPFIELPKGMEAAKSKGQTAYTLWCNMKDTKGYDASKPEGCSVSMGAGKQKETVQVPVCTEDNLATCLKPNCTAMICGDFLFKPKVSPGFTDVNDAEQNQPTQDESGSEFQNFYKAQCAFLAMDAKLKTIMQNSNGAFNRFRIGVGNSFDEYEMYRYFLPVSDQYCHINDPKKGDPIRIDRFTNYIGYDAAAKQVITYDAKIISSIKTEDNKPLPPFNFGSAYSATVAKSASPGIMDNFVFIDRTMYKFAPYTRIYSDEMDGSKLLSSQKETGYYQKLDREWYRKTLSSLYIKQFYGIGSTGITAAPYECDSEEYQCYSGRCDISFYQRGVNVKTTQSKIGSTTSTTTLHVATDCNSVTGPDRKEWIVCMPTKSVTEAAAKGGAPTFTYAKTSVRPWMFSIRNEEYDNEDLMEKWNSENKCSNMGNDHLCELNWEWNSFFDGAVKHGDSNWMTLYFNADLPYKTITDGFAAAYPETFANKWYELERIPGSLLWIQMSAYLCPDSPSYGKSASQPENIIPVWCPVLGNEAEYPPISQIVFFNRELDYYGEKFVGYAVADPEEFEQTYFAKGCGIKLTGSYTNWFYKGQDKTVSQCMQACKGTDKACGDPKAIIAAGSTMDSACKAYCEYTMCKAWVIPNKEFGNVPNCLSACTSKDVCGSGKQEYCTSLCEKEYCSGICGTAKEKAYKCEDYCNKQVMATTAATPMATATTLSQPTTSSAPSAPSATTPSAQQTLLFAGTGGIEPTTTATPFASQPASSSSSAAASIPSAGSVPASTTAGAAGATAAGPSATIGEVIPPPPCQILTAKAEEVTNTRDIVRVDFTGTQKEVHDNWQALMSSFGEVWWDSEMMLANQKPGIIDNGDLILANMPWMPAFTAHAPYIVLGGTMQSASENAKQGPHTKPYYTPSPVAAYAMTHNTFGYTTPDKLVLPSASNLQAGHTPHNQYQPYAYYALLPKYVYLIKPHKDAASGLDKVGECDMQTGTKLPRLKKYGWCDACTYSTIAFQQVKTREGSQPYVPMGEKSVETVKSDNTCALYPDRECTSEQVQTAFGSGTKNTCGPWGWKLMCSDTYHQDISDYSKSEPSKTGAPRTSPEASLIKDRIADYWKSGVLPVLDLSDKSNWDKTKPLATGGQYSEYDFKRLIGDNGATIVIVDNVLADESDSYYNSKASDLLKRTTAVRSNCPRCLTAVAIATKDLSKLNTTGRTIFKAQPQLRLQVDILTIPYQPVGMKFTGPTPYDWADEIIKNMSAIGQLSLVEFSKPVLITKFYVYTTGSVDKDGKILTKGWHDGNYGILFQTLVDRENTLVKSGILGLIFDPVRSTPAAIEGGGQSIAYGLVDTNSVKIGTKNAKFAGLQNAMERLSAGWPVAIFNKVLAQDKVECIQCTAFEINQKTCSKTCANGVKCTMPSGSKVAGDGTWRCPAGAVVQPCKLCSESSSGLAAATGGYKCTFYRANGTINTFYYAAKHITSPLYADVVGGMPDGEKCCIRDAVTGYNYTFAKTIYRQPINSPIVFSKSGLTETDCGVVPADQVPYGLFCGMKVPVNDYDITCTYEPNVGITYMALPPKSIQSFSVWSAAIASGGDAGALAQYGGLTQVTAGTGGGTVQPFGAGSSGLSYSGS